jgi:hypothetical protein
MDAAEVLETLPVTSWHGPFEASLQGHALGALESGKVLVLPQLPFAVAPGEADLLRPDVAGADRKSISLDSASGQIANVDAALGPRVAAMMQRFADESAQFLAALLPSYSSGLERARTSFRPTEIAGRATSPRHDDRRLHVDAFPSRPLRGKRILRVFTNVAPDGAPRAWRVGEPFEAYAQRFLPAIRTPLPGSSWMMQRLGLTKGQRSPYDHIMLRLHDRGKLDESYQATGPRADVIFSSGTTWLCFTDQVLHAAMAGHCVFEQTFYVSNDAMATPAITPLHVLERLMGRYLI